MSVNTQAYSQYKTSMVETASPGRLLLMLYDAAIKNLDIANAALPEKDFIKVHTHLIKTQEIILELKASLNMDIAISESLCNLYDYMYKQLVFANVKKTSEPILEVRDYLAELRSTWEEAIKKAGSIKQSQLEVAPQPSTVQTPVVPAEPVQSGAVPSKPASIGINVKG